MKLKLSIIFTLVFWVASPAQALLPQTDKDLQAAEDQLRFKTMDKDLDFNKNWLPLLVATPQAYWQESKSDFQSRVTTMLGRVIRTSTLMIPCAECSAHRTQVDHDGRLIIQNGELALTELSRIKSMPAYNEAKAVIFVDETPSGISMRVISLADGRLLVSSLVDGNSTLESVQPPMRLAREADRRMRGESLSYTFFDFGLYPGTALHLRWLEQWGSRNQFISGLTLSGAGPDGAFGGTFMYMFPFDRKLNASATVYYLLSGVFGGSGPNSDLGKQLVGEVMVQKALGSSYGIFALGNSQGLFTVGFTMFNMVLFPFLL